MGDAEVVGRDDRPADMGRDVPVADGDDHRGHDEDAGDADQRAPRVTPEQAALGPARPPQRDGSQDDQQCAGGQAHQSGEVVARGPDLPRVVEALNASCDAEHAGYERNAAAPAAAQARVRPGGEAQQAERDDPADDMVARRHAGLWLQVVVVDHVQRDQGEPDPVQERLAGPAAPPRVRRGGRGTGLVSVVMVSSGYS